MVAAGGFWFIPGHAVSRTFWALPARGLRHRRRPDLPGDGRQPLHDGARRPALRGHPHQPGPILQRHRLDLGPIIGGMYLLLQGRRRATAPAARPSIFPTSTVAVVVLVLAVIFYFAYVPDIKMEDDYHLDEADAGRLAFDLGAPALCDGRRRAVLLRRRAGGHLQLLHQLHDGRGAGHSRFLAVGHIQGLA